MPHKLNKKKWKILSYPILFLPHNNDQPVQSESCLYIFSNGKTDEIRWREKIFIIKSFM